MESSVSPGAGATGAVRNSARACPVCGERQVRTLRHQRFVLPDDHPGERAYDVVTCETCGVAFADTATTQAQYDEMYARLSRYAAGPAAHATDHDRDSSRFREVASFIARSTPPGARVLDLGCANGQLLRCLRDRGYTRLFGMDPSAACVAEANRVSGVAAAVGSLSNWPETEDPYDLVILSHVLEHVADLQAAMASVMLRLAARGMLFIEVPDAARYSDFVWSPFQDFNSEHINHFSRRSLRNVLEINGFRVIDDGTKEILSAPGMPYPAAFALAVRDDQVSGVTQRDQGLRPALELYVEKSAALLAAIDRNLRAVLPESAGVVVWGTGELTAKLMAETVLGRTNVTAFVDSNPINQGRLFAGKRVLAPAALASGSEPLVIASILHFSGIAESVRSLGLRNRIIGLTPHNGPQP